MTIHETLADPELFTAGPDDAHVLVRLYELPEEDEALVQRITFATNSQNPVDLLDLRANDEVQRRLELDLKQLGYEYRRKRGGNALREREVSSGVAAEAVLSVLRRRPHQARFFGREHFGKLYAEIFTDDLTGAQVVAAVRLYRLSEGRRRRPRDADPDFVRYASCFLAMLTGRRLAGDLGEPLEGLDHRRLGDAVRLIEENGGRYVDDAVDDVRGALQELYGDRDVSLQQLSATFRRGDLLPILGIRP